jgi:hypothetical protein
MGRLDASEVLAAANNTELIMGGESLEIVF